MRTILIIFAFISSVFVPPAHAGNFPTGDFSQMTAEGRFAVTQIVAPNVVTLNDGRIIALTGMDIPDLWHKDGAGPYAQTAKRVVTDMLLGQDVRVFRTKNKKRGRTNRMGHHIAHLQRADDGAWVQGSLILLGLARTQTSTENSDMSAQMLALENEARTVKSGLWSDPAYKAFTPDELDKTTLNRFQIVEGRIRSVSQSKNRIYLNFGDNWRDDFTVTLQPANRKNFTKAGLDPLQWNNTNIRVRGWLEFYNGPNLELTHPAQIELLTGNLTELQ